MNMNTLSLSNVVFGEKLESERSKITGVNSLIDPVVNRLATLNPLWIFEARNMGSGYRVDNFVVKLDGEPLGGIGISYMGSRGYVISVSNDRIGRGRSRSDSYRTSDADKAVLMAKKMFGKMNPNERISKAKDAAERVVTRAAWNKERERQNHTSTVHGALLSWAESKGMPMFLEFIDKEALSDTKKQVTTSIERLEVIRTDMKTIERVQTEFNDSKTALVVKDSGKYLVKVGDKVNLYDDNTLPLDMRMKMGMLKLVEDEQYLTDVGCRVTSEVFVLLVDKEAGHEGGT
jgi:hypothetical protein